MFEWVISTEQGTAYLDLRDGGLDFGEAERLLETIQPYLLSLEVGRIVVDVPQTDPLAGPVEVLVVGLESHARTIGLTLEMGRRDELLVRRARRRSAWE
jgi:hypothetical protein